MPVIPPFFENWDDSHCVQCVLRGILEHFEPNEIWDWPRWDTFTGKEEGRWTWPYRALLNMIDRGYKVRMIGPVSWKEYLNEGLYPVMVRNLGLEAANKSREMSDHESAYKDLVKLNQYWKLGQLERIERLLQYEDILKAIDDEYLVYLSLNSRALNQKDGYAGHAVLVYDYDTEGLWLHDSGLPAQEARHVRKDLIIKAGTTPTEKVWYMNAFKRDER